MEVVSFLRQNLCSQCSGLEILHCLPLSQFKDCRICKILEDSGTSVTELLVVLDI